MGLISIVWGLFAVLWMLLALVPLLGWGNWFLIPFAAVGLVIAALGMVFSRSGHRSRAKPGW
jgi:VIT1/CCC1 family predicted Fe2+/Mn2+ transporter